MHKQEYIPAGLVGLFLLAVLEPVSLLMVQGVGGAFTAGRLLHAVGLSASSGPSPGRVLGTLATWLSLIAMGGLLIWAGIAPLL